VVVGVVTIAHRMNNPVASELFTTIQVSFKCPA
jgi:hypothetical protein